MWSHSNISLELRPERGLKTFEMIVLSIFVILQLHVCAKLRAGSFEVLNKIFSTICLGVNAWNFIFNVSIHGESTFDYLCISIENKIFFLYQRQ